MACKIWGIIVLISFKAGFHLSEIFSEFVRDWVSEFTKPASTRMNLQLIQSGIEIQTGSMFLLDN